MHLGGYGPLAVRMAVVTVVLKGCLGIFLQLFGQIGVRYGYGGVVSVAIARDLELLYKAHGPGSSQESMGNCFLTAAYEREVAQVKIRSFFS